MRKLLGCKSFHDSPAGVAVLALTMVLFCAIGISGAQESGETEPASGAEDTAVEGGTEDTAGEALRAQLRFNKVDTEVLYRLLDSLPERQQRKMTLYDCLVLALVSNPDIQIQSFEPVKADGDLLAAKGEFDPQFSVVAGYSENINTPSSQTTSFLGGGLGGGGGLSSMLGGGLGGLGGGSGGGPLGLLGGATNALQQQYPIAGALLELGGTVWDNNMTRLRRLLEEEERQALETRTQRYETSVSGKTHIGTTYELKFEASEEKSTFNQFEPEWSGGATLSLTQPLLRGRGRKANLARVRSYKIARESAEQQVEQQVMSSISEVIKAYWDLVGAHEEAMVREESLANAERLLDINQRRLKLGLGAEVEVVQAEASVAARISDLFSARSQVRDAEDRLKQLLDMRDEEALVPVEIVPIDRPNLAEEVELDEELSLNRALENRPEVAIAELEIESAEVERQRAANDMQPTLDLSGTYFRGGRGRTTESIFEGIERHWDKSWSVQLQGSVPLPNRAGRGAYHKAALSKKQARYRMRKTELDIASNIRISLRGAATARTLIESNRQTVALQETNVEAEQKRLKLGMTTTYDVLKIQEDLAAAQSQEVQARINFQKAVVDLRLAEGVLLEEFGIEFEPPEPEEPIGFLRSISPIPPREE